MMSKQSGLKSNEILLANLASCTPRPLARTANKSKRFSVICVPAALEAITTLVSKTNLRLASVTGERSIP